jgi:hypothetical protein
MDSFIEVFQNPYLTTIFYFSINFKIPPYSYEMIKKILSSNVSSMEEQFTT